MFPHEYRRALAELALEERARQEAERKQREVSNEFDEDMIQSEEDLKLEKDKVRVTIAGVAASRCLGYRLPAL